MRNTLKLLALVAALVAPLGYIQTPRWPRSNGPSGITGTR